MPVELYFSNRIEQLAADLAANLYPPQGEDRLALDPLRIVVPNRNLAKWLQLTLARKQGVCMNVDYAYLDTALWDLLVNMSPGEPPPIPVSQNIYALALLRVFEQLPEEEVIFGPIRGYLNRLGKQASSANPAPTHALPADTRRWQLARKLAHLFQEYELNRPEWPSAWRLGRFESGAMAVCQGHLYRRTLQVCEQVADGVGQPLWTLPQLAQRVLDQPPALLEGTKDSRKPVVHIFGLSQISTFHTELIGRLRSWVDFRIYTLNPSADFWEDVRTPREKLRYAAGGAAAQDLEEEGATDLFGVPDHPLLSLWGKPGREHIRNLCELSGYDFNATFPPPDWPDTVLGRLQASLLSLVDVDDAPVAMAQDVSIQVVGCPGALREVETVYERILHQLEQDPTLQLTDIAVLVTDMAVYKPLFDMVFQRSPCQLSYHLVDTLAETESHYGRGVLAVLDLITGHFARREVLGLMMNPLFLARWSVDMEMVAAWARWIDVLNIYHSFDPHEKSRHGGVASPRYTWQQGLRRLRLGRIMETNSAEGSVTAAFHGLLPHQDLESADPQLLERFCLSVEEMHRHILRLRRLASNDSRWPTALLKICAELLPIGPEASGEAAVRAALAEAFEALELFTRHNGDETRMGADVPFSPDLLRAFCASHLRGLSTAHGEYLTGGVTLAALQPMRPIPYQIIYLLGMEEGGGFPGRADNSSLDLRLIKRRRGDVSTPERNTYLFLEALLSARSQVVISYVCRDLQKDKDLAPCAPVHQLKRFIADNLLSERIRFEEQRVPLKRTDPAYLLDDASPPWADPLVNTNLLDRIVALRAAGAWPPPETIPQEVIERVTALTVTPPLPPLTPAPLKSPARLFIGELRRFLLNPIHAQLARHLDVRATRPPLEALLQTCDEPFTTPFPQDYRLEREAIEHWLAACWQRPQAPPAVADLFEEIYDRQALMGSVPEGIFEELDRENMRNRVTAATQALYPIIADLVAADRRYSRVVVGHTDTVTSGVSTPQSGLIDGVRHLPPVALEAMSGMAGETLAPLEFSGELSWVWQDPGGDWHTLVLTGNTQGPYRRPNHHVIAPLLAYMILACDGSGESGLGEGGLTVHLAGRGGVSGFRYRGERATARSYLEALAASYLDTCRYFWLPFRILTRKPFEVQNLMPASIDDNMRQRFLDTLIEAWDEKGDYLSSLARPRFDLGCLDEARRRVAVFFATDEGKAGA